MPRSKKEKPNRSDGLYEVKVTVGRKVNGTLIRKSFYSSVSKADAKKKAERYLIEKEVAERTIGQFVDQDVTFKEWAIKWLETYKKGKVKGNTYSGTYEYLSLIHISQTAQVRLATQAYKYRCTSSQRFNKVSLQGIP